MKMIKLTSRLSAVAGLVEKCDMVADVGTDHGFVPTYLIQNCICKTAVASDINEGPLTSAVRTAHNYGVSDKVEFVCAPGLSGIKPGSVDAVVIAGMGGETIVDILSAAEWLKEYKTKLVLQPQSKFEMFEEYLMNNGFDISKAVLVKDSGRLYIALAVCYTGNIVDDEITYFSEYLQNDPLYVEYAEGILKKLGLRLAGLESASDPDLNELESVKNRIVYLNNILLEVRGNGNS